MGLTTTLDTSVLIAYADQRDTHHQASIRAVGSALNGGSIVISVVAYCEWLTGAGRQSEQAMRAIDSVIDSVGFELAQVDRSIARLAAQLRATHRSLKTPDALIIATGEELDATVLTFDRTWTKVSKRVRVPR